MGFNRAIRSNADTVQGRDQVTIYKVEDGDGLGYSHSFLKGTLVNGQKARISNWRNTGSALRITVHEININSSPGFADIEFTFEGVSQPTMAPTDAVVGDTPSTFSPTDWVSSHIHYPLLYGQYYLLLQAHTQLFNCSLIINDSQVLGKLVLSQLWLRLQRIPQTYKLLPPVRHLQFLPQTSQPIYPATNPQM